MLTFTIWSVQDVVQFGDLMLAKHSKISIVAMALDVPRSQVAGMKIKGLSDEKFPF